MKIIISLRDDIYNAITEYTKKEGGLKNLKTEDIEDIKRIKVLFKDYSTKHTPGSTSILKALLTHQQIIEFIEKMKNSFFGWLGLSKTLKNRIQAILESPKYSEMRIMKALLVETGQHTDALMTLENIDKLSLVKSYEKKISEYETKVTFLEANNKALSEELEKVVTERNALKNENSSLKKENAALKERVRKPSSSNQKRKTTQRFEVRLPKTRHIVIPTK